MLPGFVQTTATRLFNGITLNDIEGAAFTAHMGGPMLGASTARFEGYNVHVVKSGDDVTRMVVEFQCMDGSWRKGVVVELTNGEEGGVYARALRACWQQTSLGSQIVNYDGDEIAGYNGDSDDAVAVNMLSGRYGVYDVQAEVDVPTEWTLDQNRSWSEFTGGEPIDDAAATIRIKVTGDNPVLTIDENVTIGQIVFVNETGAAASTNAVVISGAVATIGAVKLGEGANVSLPPALASAAAALGNGSKLTYTGPATVSQTISGSGGVEVASGSVTFMAANSFTGGFVVKSGATAVAGFAPGQGATDGPFGALDGAVTAEAGGLEPCVDHGACARVLACGRHYAWLAGQRLRHRLQECLGDRAGRVLARPRQPRKLHRLHAHEDWNLHALALGVPAVRVRLRYALHPAGYGRYSQGQVRRRVERHRDRRERHAPPRLAGGGRYHRERRSHPDRSVVLRP